MYYGEMKKTDIANGEGVRVSLFVSGCRNECKGCFQRETWDFEYGRAFTSDTFVELVDALSRPWIRGLSVLGGEPFEPENQVELVILLREVKRLFPEKDVWVYTGFTFEELTGESRGRTEYTDEILGLIDVLVDGRFDEAKKDISLRFRGSSNQRIIDMVRTRELGKCEECTRF